MLTIKLLEDLENMICRLLKSEGFVVQDKIKYLISVLKKYGKTPHAIRLKPLIALKLKRELEYDGDFRFNTYGFKLFELDVIIDHDADYDLVIS